MQSREEHLVVVAVAVASSPSQPTGLPPETPPVEEVVERAAIPGVVTVVVRQPMVLVEMVVMHSVLKEILPCPEAMGQGMVLEGEAEVVVTTINQVNKEATERMVS